MIKCATLRAAKENKNIFKKNKKKQKTIKPIKYKKCHEEAILVKPKKGSPDTHIKLNSIS